LLNYLPLDRTKWTETLNRRRNEYREFVREIVIRPGYKENNQSHEIDHVNIFLVSFRHWLEIYICINNFLSRLAQELIVNGVRTLKTMKFYYKSIKMLEDFALTCVFSRGPLNILEKK